MQDIKTIRTYTSRLCSCRCLFLLTCVFLLSLYTFPQQSAAQPRFPGCDVQTQIPEEECNALQIFFEKTEGVRWANRGGWMIAGQACEWMGVVCETGPWPRNVRKIILIDNDVGGNIPGELSFLTELEELVVQTTATAGYFNVVEGFLPSALGDLANLKVLRISGHEIRGPIPNEWANLESLEVLDLSRNLLDGRVPDVIGSMSTLKEIDLSSNDFLGSIPQTFGNLINLEKLDLGSNKFSGPIPQNIGQLQKLTLLDLRENNFSGSIPASLGSLPDLISLTLTDNELEGPPPPSVIQLASQLSICSLAQQSPQFCIPDNSMYRAEGATDLCGVPFDSSCSFCSSSQSNGNGSCSTLESIFYKTEGINWANQSGWLSSSDPCDWYGLSCTDGDVNTLSLPGNNLAGDIPEEIGELPSLTSLDLSDNALTGPLPLSVALLQNTTDSCNLSNNDGSLCLPDTPDIAAIGSESICGLPIALSCSAVGSPGTFSTIEARADGDSHELIWRAALRAPEVRFEVERKENGAFAVIGIVDLPDSQDDPELFSYPLPELDSGIHTFRIKMTSLAGASLYSDELDVLLSNGNFLLEPPFPNPTQQAATLRFVVQETQPVQLSLYDVTGRSIRILYDDTPEVDIVQEVFIQTGGMASGIYFLRLEGTTFGATQTLVIQK